MLLKGDYKRERYVPKPRISSVKTPGSLSIRHHSPPVAIFKFYPEILFKDVKDVKALGDLFPGFIVF